MNRSRFRYAVGLAIYVAYLLILTLNPFEFSVVWFRKFTHWGTADALWRTYQFKGYDIVGNIALFIPFGFFLARLKGWTDKRHWRRAALWGGGFSLVIELTQLIMPRSTSIIDVATNALGAALGAWWALKHPPESKDLSPLLRRTAWLWAVVVVLLALAPAQMSHLNGWDDGYPLLLGNEATGDRPWEGRLRLVALYGRALKGDEVASLATDTTEREALGARVLQPSERAFSDTLVTFPPPIDFYSQARNHRGFSVEAWIDPATLDQGGPARIVSASKSPDLRNFTLGQEGARLQLRVRTPLAGANGSKVCLTTPPVLRAGQWQHIVAVFHSGGLRLYVDGRLAGGAVHPFRHYFSERLLGFGDNAFARFAVAWALFFPLALAGATLFRWAGWVLALLPPVLVEAYSVGVLGQPLDVPFVWQAALILLLGGLAGRLLRPDKTGAIPGK